MSLTVSPTDEDLTAALGDFIEAFCVAGTLSIVGQVNRVPEPKTPNFVVMVSTGRTRLDTNVETWGGPAPTTIEIAQATRCDVQLDFHGPDATDNCQIITTMMRSMAGADWFDADGRGFQTLYASDPVQMPITNAESQYEDRWIVRASLQATPVVSAPQQFADTLDIELVDVDVVYPG